MIDHWLTKEIQPASVYGVNNSTMNREHFAPFTRE